MVLFTNAIIVYLVTKVNEQPIITTIMVYYKHCYD